MKIVSSLMKILSFFLVSYLLLQGLVNPTTALMHQAQTPETRTVELFQTYPEVRDFAKLAHHHMMRVVSENLLEIYDFANQMEAYEADEAPFFKAKLLGIVSWSYPDAQTMDLITYWEMIEKKNTFFMMVKMSFDCTAEEKTYLNAEILKAYDHDISMSNQFSLKTPHDKILFSIVAAALLATGIVAVQIFVTVKSRLAALLLLLIQLVANFVTVAKYDLTTQNYQLTISLADPICRIGTPYQHSELIVSMNILFVLLWVMVMLIKRHRRLSTL